MKPVQASSMHVAGPPQTYFGKGPVLNDIHRTLARQLHTNTCHRVP